MLLRERVAAKLAMRVGIREVTNHATASHSIVFRIVHVCFRIVDVSLTMPKVSHMLRREPDHAHSELYAPT